MVDPPADSFYATVPTEVLLVAWGLLVGVVVGVWLIVWVKRKERG